MTTVIESPQYGIEAERLASLSITVQMFDELPQPVKDALAKDEHLPGMMGAANDEWARRNMGEFDPPQYLGSVARALGLLAKRASA